MAYTTIDDPSAYFQTKTYTGTGNSHAITLDGNSDLSPNWVWIKCRDDSHNHQIFDTVRGVHKRMRTDTSGAETTSNESLKSFDSDGFTLGTQANVNAAASGDNSFVAWNWKETADAGFDIVGYTGNGTAGRTVAHSLSAVPKMIIVKRYNDGTASWMIYHHTLGNNKYLSLDTTAAQDAGHWDSTSPTSSVFSVSGDQRVNNDGASYFAYCFAEKQGFSKFGKYSGNGNANGPFIYTGFRPAFTIIKRIDATNDWMIGDNKITTFNPKDGMMRANLSNVELSTNPVDYLANGFKIRLTGNAFNNSGGTYVYMAFAENPFTTSTGVPGNAG